MSQPQPQASQPQITTPQHANANDTSATATASTSTQHAATATAPNTAATTQNATSAAAPAAGAASTTLTASYPPETPSQTYNEKLNASDRYWKFKIGGYALCVIMGLIGVGCFGWATSTFFGMRRDFVYGYDSEWALPWPLITFGVSVIWSFIVIVVFLMRKRPVHPGVRVAMDLLLWLAFIPTVLCALLSFSELLNWGRYGVIDQFYYYSSSSDGQYQLASNGTWIWEQSRSSSTTFARSCSTRSGYSYYDSAPFGSCADQDAYINKLWQQKPHRMDVILTGVVCQFFGLVLHFALFVWACVDTNHYNRNKVGKDAEKIAAGIVEKMIQNGTVIRPPGQTYAPPQQYHYPQQGYQAPQGQMMYPQMYHQGQMPQQGQMQQGQMHPAPPAAAMTAAGPSHDKSVGPRYA